MCSIERTFVSFARGAPRRSSPASASVQATPREVSSTASASPTGPAPAISTSLSGNRVLEHADPLDLAADDVAGPEVRGRLVVHRRPARRAGGDDVAGE